MNFNNNHGLNVETYALLMKKIQAASGATMDEVLAITGDKTDLETDNKDNLVAAVNEIVADLENKGVHILGTSITPLTDGAATNPIIVDGNSITAVNGDIAIYNNAEFIFSGTRWSEFGDLSGLGSMAFENANDYMKTVDLGGLAFKNNATGKYTTINSMGTLPTLTYDSSVEELTLTMGTLPTTTTATITVE